MVVLILVVRVLMVAAIDSQTVASAQPFEDRGPRLGDAAFRAQREALESAQFALKKLAAAAHGEVLVQLLEAWKDRAADKVPSAQDLGKQLPPTARSAWTSALAAAPTGKQADAETALLRLEMAAELPTPAEHLAARPHVAIAIAHQTQ